MLLNWKIHVKIGESYIQTICDNCNIDEILPNQKSGNWDGLLKEKVLK